MGAQSPHIVGIVGPSCAGKTWLASRLSDIFKGATSRLSLDDFYRDRSHLSPARRSRLNFDHPRAIEWRRLESVLESFARGRAASAPRYDFVRHGRLEDEQWLEPGEIVLVEGLWLFRRPSLRGLFGTKVFIQSSSELCARRRLERDTRERGRTRQEVLDQLERFTFPMSARFVASQERWADIILTAPLRESDVELVAQRIRSRLQPLHFGI